LDERQRNDLKKYPEKIIGGITAACTQVATHLYAQIIETVVLVSSSRVTEMVKLLESTFRAVSGC
jgi:UDP-N-acetyl-D-glucosamine dehydrogenase